jgi:WD40 repeat protein
MNKRRTFIAILLSALTLSVFSACKPKATESNANLSNNPAVAKPTPRSWEYKQDLGPKSENQLIAVAFSSDSSLIGIVGYYPTMIWNVENKKFKQMLVSDQAAILSIAFSPDGNKIATGGALYAHLWDARNSDEKNSAPLKTLGDDVLTSAAVFTPDSKTLATTNYHNGAPIRLWDVETGKLKKEWKAHDGPILGLAISPDGKTLATASDDKTIKLWDLETGKEKQTLTGHAGNVVDVNFSPDGSLLVSASFDKTVRLWDAQTGALKQTLNGHGDQVYEAAFSPDGTIIATCSADKSLRLWDAQTGAPLQTFTDHARDVRGLAFSPDGKWLATVSYDGTVKLYAPK